MSGLLVVSNRLPAIDAQAGAGGLAVGLEAALKESGGLWLGWNGDVGDSAKLKFERPRRSNGFHTASLELTEAELHGYYREFANRCLWPLFHSRLDLARFAPDAYRVYRDVNGKFARAVEQTVNSDDLIWVHDYHLISLGRILRRRLPEARIGFFLHIPFPPPEIFAVLPWAHELAMDMLSYDLVGVQTEACAWNFQAYVRRFMHGTVGLDNRIFTQGASAMTGVFPIGIDTRAIAKIAQSPMAIETARRIVKGSHETSIIAGVERLDYTKGIPQRLQAFELFLERHEKYRGRVSLIQIAAPSRIAIPEYQSVAEEVEGLAGHINGRFGTFEWTPAHFINRPVSQEEVAALYRISKVGLVTPLKDGMNLVAKEYVAAQDAADPGALVLSRFAGAAEELTDAIIVNPYDIGAMAESLAAAIELPRAERVVRWRRMMAKLETNDIHRWRRSFLTALSAAAPADRRAAANS